MGHARKSWVTPRVTTRLAKTLAERPDLLANPEARQAVLELQKLERMLHRLDESQTDDSLRERMRGDMLLGMARQWSKLNDYLGD
jgi:hypothetical protein